MLELINRTTWHRIQTDHKPNPLHATKRLVFKGLILIAMETSNLIP
jgi:hypothetical protein